MMLMVTSTTLRCKMAPPPPKVSPRRRRRAALEEDETLSPAPDLTWRLERCSLLSVWSYSAERVLFLSRCSHTILLCTVCRFHVCTGRSFVVRGFSRLLDTSTCENEARFYL